MQRSAFVPALALAIIFVCAKVALTLGTPVYLGFASIVAVTAEDLAAALLFGAAAALLLRATARAHRAHRWAWRAVCATGAAAALFAVVNIGIFKTLGYPLTARMFALVGRLPDLRSSIEERMRPGIVAGLIAAPLVYLLATRWRPAFARRRGPRVAAVSLALVWVVAGLSLRAQAPPESWRRRAGINPHRELVGTLLSSVLLTRRVDIDHNFPPGYLDDFKLAAERRRPPLPQYAPPPRNVILVVLESTAAQYLSVYGAAYDTTPRLAAELRNAIVFDRFYANAGYTSQSFVPLTTSVYPGLPWAYRTSVEAPIPTGLAKLLRDRGYRTALAAAANPEWHDMGWRAKNAGFEEVLGPVELDGPMASSWGTEDGVMIDGLIRWIDRAPARPFFAIGWTDQTHDPYTLAKETVPVDFLDETKVANGALFERYLNAIRQADHHLGRLFDALRARNLADDTLVVITGDHGEAFGHEHDDAFSHAHALYDECQRVPMILWNPRLFAGGGRNSIPSAHVDVNPTIAHLLGVDPNPAWQGASLFSPDHPRRAYMALEFPDYQFALVDERYKYILHLGHGYDQLFDLGQDPREQHDLAKSQPEVAAQMRKRVAAFVASEERSLKSR